MGTCQWKPPEEEWNTDEYEGCQHPLHGASDYCIFHIPLEDKRKDPSLADEFKASFDCFFVNMALKPEAGDFVGFVFPDGIDLSNRDFLRAHERKQEVNLLGSKPVNFSCALFGNKAVFRQAKFGNEANFESTKFGNKANFGGARFGDKANFGRARFGDKAFFYRIVFGDEVNLEHAIFGNNVSFSWAAFGSKANFAIAFFGKNAIFNHVIFSDEARFIEATFNDKSRFKYAHFGDNVTFISSHFGNKTNWVEAKLGKYASFREATFGINANLNNATLGDKASFTKSIFGDGASIVNVLFGDEPDFSEATFLGLVDFSGIRVFETAFRSKTGRFGRERSLEWYLKKPTSKKHLNFRKTIFRGPAKFHDTDLSKARFELVDLQNLSFFKSKISQTEFVSCTWGFGPENRKYWHRSGGHLFGFKRSRMLLDELLWRKKNINRPHTSNTFYRRRFPWLKDIALAPLFKIPMCEAVDKMEPPVDLHAEDIELLSLQLKQSLEATKDPITAGDFHFAVMEMKLEKAREAHRSARALALTLYKFVNGYGERYARTMMWIALLVAIWTGFYSWNGEFVPSDWTCREVAKAVVEAKTIDLPPPITIWEYLLFALQNILPFKFGHPVLNPCSTWAKALTFAETFIGTSLFSLMLLALRRRFKR